MAKRLIFSFSPHPNPLPQGEGIMGIDQNSLAHWERAGVRVFLMLVLVEMAVTVYQLLVPVRVLVDKVGTEEEIRVGKELFRLAISHQAMFSP